MGDATSRLRYSLSPSQARNFLENAVAETNRGLNVQQVVCRSTEALDLPVFQQAWQKIVDCHAVLRAAFGRDEQQHAFQEIHAPVEVTVRVEAHRELKSSGQEIFVEERLRRDRLAGFDLAAPPLMRVTVLQFTDDVTWIWTFHQILIDERSALLVLEDFFACYESLASHRPVVLSERKEFSEFVSWHREWMTSHQPAAESFWRGLYADDEIDAVLSIRRASSGDQRQVKLELKIDDDKAAHLRRVAGELGLTIETIIQGTWALLLSRYYRSRSVTFSTIRSGREGSTEGTEGMIGTLTNFVPVHIRISDEMSARDLFRSLEQQQAAARTYQWTPLEIIRNAIPAAAGKQLFDSCVLYYHCSIAQEMTERLGKNGARTFSLWEDSNLPLLLLVRESPRFECELIYQSGLFEEQDVHQLSRSFLALLHQVLATPDAPVASLELLDAGNKAEVIRKLTGPACSFPEEKALHHWFEDQVRKNPQAIAIVGESDVTYGQLDRRANEMARRLMASGAAPDRLVAIYLPRSVNCLVAILGVLKSGAAYLPIDVQIPQVRAKGLLEDANACALITESALAPNLPASSTPVLLLDEHGKDSSPPPDQPLPKIRGSQLAYVIPTSGTTGRPKLIGVEHRQTANLLTYATQSLLQADDVRWAPFIDSPSFDSSVSQIFTTLALGGTLVLLPDIAAVQTSPYYEKFTCLGSTPSLLATILKEKGLPPAVQLIGLGAEAIPPDLLEKLDALPQIRKVINYYGPSEATVYCTVAIALDRSNPDSKVDLRNQGRIIGCPIANTCIYLVDEFGQLAPPGAPGEIYIAGAAVARGYLNLAGKAAENFLLDSFSPDSRERMYRSGDIARLRTDGQLEFHGRKDHQLKLNGVRIEAAEIENALLNVPGIRQALVDVRPDAEGKKRLVAYLAAGPGNFSKQNLRKDLRLLLPGSMVPHHFVVLADLPLTSNGKVDREALSRCELESETSADGDSAATPAERQMKELWEQNLNRSAVGLEQDYFEMGGDSLSAVNLMLAIERKFGVKLSTQLLLECSTVADLTRQVQSGSGAAKPRKAASPASFVFLQESGSGVLLVLLPGGAGTTFLNYKNFAMKFAPDHPVYALQSIYALMLEKPADPLVYIAGYIADQIMTVIKDRPFVLFGHCIGGLLAWHVACVLKKRNAPPFELVIYDAPAAQEGINMTTSLPEEANRSRLQKMIRAYRPAWEEWCMENGNSLKSKGGFLLSVLRNFLVRRGFLRSGDGRVKFAKLSYYRLLQDSPLEVYPNDALLIYHHSQTEIVSSSLWQSLCTGEVEYQFIPGDHSDWQNAILRIIPMIGKKLEKVAVAREPALNP